MVTLNRNAVALQRFCPESGPCRVILSKTSRSRFKSIVNFLLQKRYHLKYRCFLKVIEKDRFCHLNVFLALTCSIVTFILITAGEMP